MKNFQIIDAVEGLDEVQVIVCEEDELSWYCVIGTTNVLGTYNKEVRESGVNLADLDDVLCREVKRPIKTIRDMRRAIKA